MAKPFVKWAGGKSQLLNVIDDRIGAFREKSNGFIYVEPFVGGGSVLFHLLDTCSNLKYAVINDASVASFMAPQSKQKEADAYASASGKTMIYLL